VNLNIYSNILGIFNMTLQAATITLILVMDPLGNIPAFLSILNPIETKRRPRIIMRETFIAFLILSVFLFCGQGILNGLNITQPALGIAGGIILFLIAVKMIFPQSENASSKSRESFSGEPFIVPLAIPLVAGPSAMATILLFTSQAPDQSMTYFLALTLASIICGLTLLFSNQLRKLLGQKGLIAVERLMGMILTTLAVQMFLNGVGQYFKL
jgi:multiple antibiotic resistance protein